MKLLRFKICSGNILSGIQFVVVNRISGIKRGIEPRGSIILENGRKENAFGTKIIGVGQELQTKHCHDKVFACSF